MQWSIRRFAGQLAVLAETANLVALYGGGVRPVARVRLGHL